MKAPVTPNWRVWTLLRGGDKRSLTASGLNYVLAGSDRSWKLPCAHCATGDAIRIEGNDEASGATLDNSVVIGP